MCSLTHLYDGVSEKRLNGYVIVELSVLFVYANDIGTLTTPNIVVLRLPEIQYEYVGTCLALSFGHVKMLHHVSPPLHATGSVLVICSMSWAEEIATWEKRLISITA